MLNAIDGADDIYFDVVSQTRIDRWSHGRVVLIGDAAGCISLLGGEGTGLVMTVAYALAGEPHRAGDDCQQAFQAYETLMHPFVGSKQAGAQRFIELSVGPAATRPASSSYYSHSMVPGGLLVTSSTTRFTSGTSLVIRVEMRSSTS